MNAAPRANALVLATALLSAAALAPAAHAQPSDLGVDDGGGWAEIFDADRRMGLHYRRLGLAKLLEAMEAEHPHLGDAPRWLVLEQALVRFERARQRIPNDPELAYYTAHALTRWERAGRDGGTELRVEEAIDAWHRLRELAPDFMPDRVAYELAILHTRRHEFERARAEYEASLGHAVPPTVQLINRYYMANGVEESLATLFAPIEPTQVYGNLAEVAMLAGDLDAAIRSYRTVVERSDYPLSRSLAQWGLAVAQSRADGHERALEAAGRAIREDPLAAGGTRYDALHTVHGAFTVLHIDGVFFEPPYELHAYEAIGHEAMAREPDADRPEHLRAALRSWRLYLTEGGIGSRFAAHARGHAARLETELEAAAPSTPPSARGRPR